MLTITATSLFCDVKVDATAGGLSEQATVTLPVAIVGKAAEANEGTAQTDTGVVSFKTTCLSSFVAAAEKEETSEIESDNSVLTLVKGGMGSGLEVYTLDGCGLGRCLYIQGRDGIKYSFRLKQTVPTSSIMAISSKRLAQAGYYSILDGYESLHLCG